MKLSCLSLLLFTFYLLLTGCDPETPEVNPSIIKISPSKGKQGVVVKISGQEFGNNVSNLRVRFNGVDAVIQEVTDTTIITLVPAQATTGKVIISVKNKTVTSTEDFTILTGTWTSKLNFPGKSRGSAITVAGENSGFLALGGAGDFPEGDIWEYFPAQNTWVRRPDFPGQKRLGGIGFQIANKIYITAGFTYYPIGFKNDFWEYNIETYAWAKKTDFPGTGRWFPAAFAMQGKGYITTGAPEYFSQEIKDMWEYNPGSDTWSKKNDIPFTTRGSAVSSVLGNKAIIGSGVHVGFKSETNLFDFWQYDQTLDAWSLIPQMNDKKKLFKVSFVLGNALYLIEHSGECWQYDLATNQWTEKTPYPGAGRNTFVIGDKAFVVDSNKRTLYEFNPE